MKKTARLLKTALLRPFFDGKRFLLEEKTKFLTLGIDYDSGVRATIESGLVRERPPWISAHLILFAGLALRNYQAPNILEIGTFEAWTTRFLSHFFPKSDITTIELPEDDPIYLSTYSRETSGGRGQVEERMHANLAQTQAMQLRVNSFFLPAQCNKKFDLAWIDGGHMYPEIAWDACNAFHLCKDGGMLVFDDVVLHAKPSDRLYLSEGMVTILEYVARRSSCRVTFLMKYVHPYSSGLPRQRRYIAVVEKAPPKSGDG